MRLIIATLFALLSFSTAAQYKCTAGGKTVYSDAPCGKDAQAVGRLEDRVSVSARREAEERRSNDASRRDEIRYREGIEERNQEYQRQRAIAADQSAQADKARRCSQAKADVASAKRRLNIYADAGMQRSTNGAKSDLDDAEARVFRECP